MSHENFINKAMSPAWYYWGIFCFIPYIGFVLGIGLIYFGLIKFKNWKLASIGMVGIIFTIIFNSYSDYRFNHGKDFTNGFEILTADKLDEIAERLEVFRLVNGIYPDSLEELQGKERSLSIVDVLSERNLTTPKKQKFYYKRMDDKYILFSMGVDGIPNTKDDIYPRRSIKEPNLNQQH